MPCRVEPTEAELEAGRRATLDKEIARVVKPLLEKNDTLTHENDILRELVLKLATKEDMPATLYDKLRNDQAEHRKEDLRRLNAHFTKLLEDAVKEQGIAKALQTKGFKENSARLEKVLRADPTKPLEPQLGFDPDAY